MINRHLWQFPYGYRVNCCKRTPQFYRPILTFASHFSNKIREMSAIEPWTFFFFWIFRKVFKRTEIITHRKILLSKTRFTKSGSGTLLSIHSLQICFFRRTRLHQLVLHRYLKHSKKIDNKYYATDSNEQDVYQKFWLQSEFWTKITFICKFSYKKIL